MKIPVFKTKDFIIRPYKLSDAKSLAKNINDKAIAKNMSRVPYPYTIKHARQFIERALKEYRKKNKRFINFTIIINGEVKGGIGFNNIQGHKTTFGYWLAKDLRGRGIMTRIAKIITNYGFKNLKFKRISANVFSWNIASKRVLEKCGFKYEGTLKKDAKKGNKYFDTYLYAKVK